MKKIGVERGLSTIAAYLNSEGYSVEMLGEDLHTSIAKYGDLDVIISADYNTNMMGFSDASTRVPIINASGLTGEEVKSMIEQKTTR